MFFLLDPRLRRAGKKNQKIKAVNNFPRSSNAHFIKIYKLVPCRGLKHINFAIPLREELLIKLFDAGYYVFSFLFISLTYGYLWFKVIFAGLMKMADMEMSGMKR